eukprot:3360845-Alexandrium_andersonii.AAC.1
MEIAPKSWPLRRQKATSRPCTKPCGVCAVRGVRPGSTSPRRAKSSPLLKPRLGGFSVLWSA